jgi:hypothetical protein
MRLSRSKIEVFIECPRCFYFEVKLKKFRPPSFPFTLNNAVDLLLKKEFDAFRVQGLPHPLQKNLKLTPVQHKNLDVWRDVTKGGISYLDENHACTYYGAIDDLWVNEEGKMVVVDYKATAKNEAVTNLPVWASSYVRQLSFYNFLLRLNGFDMLNHGFLVYATAMTSEKDFNNRLSFVTNVIEIPLDEAWIKPTLEAIHHTLDNSEIPESSDTCMYCEFVKERSNGSAKDLSSTRK